MTPLNTDTDEVALRRVAPVRFRAGFARWEVRSAAAAQAIGELLREPERFTARPDSVIHQTWLVTVTRACLPALGNGSWLLRRSNYAKASARKRDFFRTAAPIRAFRNALALEAAGIPTPCALAAGVRRVLRVPRAGYLLTEEVSDAVAVARLMQSEAGASRAAVSAVAEAIAQLHERGFIHGDLTINNILLDGVARPWFIDLERTRRVRGPVNWGQAVEDFHRLARHFSQFSPAGRSGALRVVVLYCAARGWAGREMEFAQAIYRRVKTKIAQDEQA
jgi:serine/threonine-protein kinase RIO1